MLAIFNKSGCRFTLTYVILSVIFCCSVNDNKRFNEAESLYYSGKIEDAKSLYQDLIKSNPNITVRNSIENQISRCNQIIKLRKDAKVMLDNNDFKGSKEKYLEIYHLNSNAIDTPDIFKTIDKKHTLYKEEQIKKISKYHFTLFIYRFDVNSIVLHFDVELIGWGILQDKYETSDNIRKYLDSNDFIDSDNSIHESYNELIELSYIDNKCIDNLKTSYTNYQSIINLLYDFRDYSKERFMEKFNDLKSEILIDLNMIESHLEFLEKKL